MLQNMNDQSGARSPDTSVSARFRSDDLCKRIYRHVVESIKSGELGPGAKVAAERQLMVSFGASRAVVRRAMQILEEDGLVERRIGSGTFVRQGLSTIVQSQSDDIPAVSPLDVLEARLVIEPGMADLVVARATDSDFERIEAALKNMENVAASGTQMEFKESGYLVHIEIVRATRNPLLIRFYENLIEARVRAGWDTLKQLNDTPELRLEQVDSVRKLVSSLRLRHPRDAREISRRSKLRMIHQVVGLGGGGEGEV